MDEAMTEALVRNLRWEAAVEGLSNIVTVRDVLGGLERIYRHGDDRGISTGWFSLDPFYTVKKGEMCIVTGVPTHGKSEFLDALTMNLARKHDWKFLMFSPENKPYERHVRKLIEKYVGVSMRHEERTGAVTLMPLRDLGSGIEFVQSHYAWADIRNEQASADKILEVFCHMADHHGYDGFVLDPWNEIEHRRPKDYTETEYISLVLSIMREFARMKNVALWIVAHPAKMQRNKNTGEYPVPSLWDISGSAHWRAKADVGIVVHREDITQHNIDVHVQKVRFKSTGKPGTVTLLYDWWSGRLYGEGTQKKED